MHDNDHSEALAAEVRDAIASGTALRIRGGDTRAFYGRRVSTERVIDTRQHSGIVLYEPSELAITVRSGTRLQELIDALAAKGQELPFEPPAFGDESTVGGAIASGLAGPRRPYTGAVRDALLGVRLINGKGEILNFGGQVMKNVAGYDLSRPMAGAHGTLGLLLNVSLKLKPIAPGRLTLVFEMSKAAALETLRGLYRNPANLSAVCWVDNRLYLRLEGFAESIEQRADELGGDRLDDAATFWRDLRDHRHPFFAPGGQPLWRLAVKPASGELSLPGDELIDWVGGQRWLRSDADADTLRKIARAAGGHATLFRAVEPSQQPFHPLEPALMALHQQLKQALDPQRIFNPGRMYPEV